MSSPIQQFIKSSKDLQTYLIEQNQYSMQVEVNNHYKKILLLSCASLYESQIVEIIQNFVKKNITDDRIFDFLKNKAIKRQYHTYFDWNQTNNINNFLGLFGIEVKKEISKKISDDENLSNQVKAFLIIGSERNKMVHENFLEYQLNKTYDEILKLHSDAEMFIDFIRSVLE